MKNIIWAVNPFDGVTSVRPTKEFVEKIGQKLKAIVTPTYVVSPAELRVATGYEFPPNETVHDTAMKVLERWLKRAKFKDGGKAEVLVFKNALTTRTTTAALEKLANKAKADAIVVSSNAKSVTRRFFLGSFSESLVAVSQRPVFVVSPNVSSIKPLTKILLPFVNGKVAEAGMVSTARLARDLDAEIILYHYIEKPSSLAFSDVAIMYDMEEEKDRQYVVHQMELSKRQAAALSAIARRMKVPCRVVIENGDVSPDQRILDFAKAEGVQMISLPLSNSIMRRLFLGGISRSILRSAKVPVFVTKPSR